VPNKAARRGNHHHITSDPKQTTIATEKVASGPQTVGSATEHG
jgi:hypothetical protein